MYVGVSFSVCCCCCCCCSMVVISSSSSGTAVWVGDSETRIPIRGDVEDPLLWMEILCSSEDVFLNLDSAIMQMKGLSIDEAIEVTELFLLRLRSGICKRNEILLFAAVPLNLPGRTDGRTKGGKWRLSLTNIMCSSSGKVNFFFPGFCKKNCLHFRVLIRITVHLYVHGRRKQYKAT